MSTSAQTTTPEPGLLELIKSDIDAARDYYGGSALARAFPNIFVPVTYRIAHALDVRGLRWVAQAISIVCHILTGAEIRPGARIGPRMVIVHTTGVVIGNDVVAGSDLLLLGANTLGQSPETARRPEGSPRLGYAVILATHSSIVGPVVIGDRVLVGAYACVMDDMPDDSRPKGVPARP